MKRYYRIEPDVKEDAVAYIDDWEFKYWREKPEMKIIQNADGTFSVKTDKNFVPLVEQLQSLFKNGNVPEYGTYLGEASLTGKKKPTDCIYGDFINSNRGMVMSTRLLELIREFNIPGHNVYKLPLIQNRQKFNDYNYVYFEQNENDFEQDIVFIKDRIIPVLCVSERLKEEIYRSEIEGCEFTEISGSKK